MFVASISRFAKLACAASFAVLFFVGVALAEESGPALSFEQRLIESLDSVAADEAYTGDAYIEDEAAPLPHEVRRPVLDGVRRPARYSPCASRPADQLWMISSRGLRCPSVCGGDTPALQVWYYANGRWFPATVRDFLASDAVATQTTVYVHGNRVSFGESRQIGMKVYDQLVRCTPSEQPLRFVIWSWPSDQIKGQLKDIRIKGARAHAEGYYLAWLLDQVKPSIRMTLMGYSFGTRIVSGSLHVLGGGAVAGRSLAHRAYPERHPLRAVLMASALDSDWLLPGRPYGLALSQVDHLLLLNNPCDRALERYRFTAKYRPEALGYVGLNVNRLRPHDRAKVTQHNVCHREHDWTSYLYSFSVQTRLRIHAFWPLPQLLP